MRKFISAILVFRKFEHMLQKGAKFLAILCSRVNPVIRTNYSNLKRIKKNCL